MLIDLIYTGVQKLKADESGTAGTFERELAASDKHSGSIIEVLEDGNQEVGNIFSKYTGGFVSVCARSHGPRQPPPLPPQTSLQ